MQAKKATRGRSLRRLVTVAGLTAAVALAPALAGAHGADGDGPGMMGWGMMGPGMRGPMGPGVQGMPMGPGGMPMMGPGTTMSPWMMQMMMRGMGQGMPMMGPGAQGMPMGPGMMGPGAGQGMMGPGMMGPGMMGQGVPCPGAQKGAARGEDLTPDDVRARLEAWLQAQGNPRLAVGEVKEKDEDTIVADIVTKKGGVLVDRFEVDRHTGAMRRVVEQQG